MEKMVSASDAKLLKLPVLNKAILAKALADFAADADGRSRSCMQIEFAVSV